MAFPHPRRPGAPMGGMRQPPPRLPIMPRPQPQAPAIAPSQPSSQMQLQGMIPPPGGGAMGFSTGGSVDDLGGGLSLGGDNGIDDALDVVRRAMDYGMQQAGLTPMIPGSQSEHWPGGKPADGPVRPVAANEGPTFGKRQAPPQPQQITPPGTIKGPDVDWNNPGGNSLVPSIQKSEEEPDDAGGLQLASNDNDEDDKVQSFEDGGTVEEEDDQPVEQPQPEQGEDDTTGSTPQPEEDRPIKNFMQSAVGGVRNKLASYIQGADALPPETVKALEAQAGDDNPDMNKLKVVQAAAEQGGPKAAWGAIQAYRKKYNLLNGFAAVKLNQGDTPGAAKAATLAQQNMPDGNTATFHPTPDGGVTVAVTGLDGDSQPQQFKLTREQFNMFLRNNPGQFDNVVRQGSPNVLSRIAQAPGMPLEQAMAAKGTYNPELMARARDMHPSVGEAGQRQQLYLQLEREQAAREAQVQSAQAKQKGALDVAGVRADASRFGATQRNEASHYRTDRNYDMSDKKLAQQADQFLAKQEQAATDGAQKGRINLMRSMINNYVLLDPQQKQTVDKFVQETFGSPSGGSAPAPAVPQRGGQAPQTNPQQQGGMRTFNSPEEVQAAGLPSGTPFKTRDGRVKYVP